MFEELFDEFSEVIRAIDYVEPVKFAEKICKSWDLTYDEKVEWLDKLSEFCDNNYRNESKESIADKVNDVASYFEIINGDLYNGFNAKSEYFHFKVITIATDTAGGEESYFDTIEEALAYIPKSGAGLIRRVLRDADIIPEVTSKEFNVVSCRYIFRNGKWIFDSFAPR